MILKKLLKNVLCTNYFYDILFLVQYRIFPFLVTLYSLLYDSMWYG